ncbi:MAG: efflux RND transporter periplasmic adaptor subunit [Polyangiales bacterium]
MSLFRIGLAPRTVAVGACLWLGACAEDARAARPSPEPRAAPETVRVTATRMPRMLSYVGTITAARDATIASAAGGRIERYASEVGQRVAKDDVLVSLVSSELAYASKAAKASATQVAARIAGIKDPAKLPGAIAVRAALEARIDAAQRAEKLFAQGSLSEQELHRAKTDEAAARAQYDDALTLAKAEFLRLKELRAMAAQANVALDDRTVRAPFAGIVLERFVEVGHVAAPHAPLLRVVDLSEVRVRFDVPQFDADEVMLGRKVRVLADGRRLEATVMRSTPGLVGTAHARWVEARIEQVPAEGLLPGARVPVWLETGEQETLIEIPRSATTQTAGLSRAWVLESGRLSERLLSVVRIEGERVIVRDGLVDGELLVKFPQASFRLGEEVAR